MKRGDIITVALQGDYGKPRPAVIIESDLVPPSDSVLVCLLSSTLHGEGIYRRHTVQPTPENGLRAASQVMVDKVIAVRRVKCGTRIGAFDRTVMRALTGKLSILIGIED